MAESSINIDLNDPRTGKIASAISNKTSKKILGLLVDEEMSESDLAKKLGLPINTIEYNLKILIESGLIEKSKKFFWSVKGKKIPVYCLANKRIVISPKKMIRGVLPAVVVSGIAALFLRMSFVGEKAVSEMQRVGEAASFTAESRGADFVRSVSSDFNLWIWFFAGALFSLMVYFLWNFFVNRKGFK